MVEVGYCSDTRWRDKVKEKMGQHKELMGLLKLAGWTVDETPALITVGACGAVYQSGLEALQRLGLSTTQGKTLLTKLHGIAIEEMRNISLARRRLERCCVAGYKKGVG